MKNNFIKSMDKVISRLTNKINDNDINKKLIHLLKNLPELFDSNFKKNQKIQSILKIEVTIIS